jgi:hypothetical protein
MVSSHKATITFKVSVRDYFSTNFSVSIVDSRPRSCIPANGATRPSNTPRD